MKGLTRGRQFTVALFIIGIICGCILTKIFEYVEKYNKHETGFKVNSVTAEKLEEKIRILCFIPTGPKSYRPGNTKFIRETWGKRCNILLFMASYSDDELPTVALPSPEGRYFLWNKTKESIKYIYKNYEGKYDWVWKADDDTYTIMENLRLQVKDINPEKPIIFGDFNTFFTVINGSHFPFMWGGAGYILSRGAVRKFVNEGLIGGACNDIKNVGEDIGAAVCAKRLGIESGESRDYKQRKKYFTDVNNGTFAAGSGKTFKLDFKRYSNMPIGFHTATITDMVLTEYLLYHVRVEALRPPEPEYP